MMTSTKTTRQILTASAAVLCAFILPAHIHAQIPQYTATVLGYLGTSASEPVSINASGQVAGNIYNAASDRFVAVLWTPTANGTTQTNLTPLSNGSFIGDGYAYGINASGHVVGESAAIGISSTPVVWNPNGTIQTTLNSYNSATHTSAINDSGQVVGSDNGHAVYFNGTSRIVLGTLGSGTVACGINASGNIVGFAQPTGSGVRAVVWNAATPTATPTILASLGGSGQARAINASGQIAGYSYTAFNAASKSVVWNANGTIQTNLGSLGGSGSEAYGINASGQVVGMSSLPEGGFQEPFLYTGGTIYDLNTLLAPGSGVTNLIISDKTSNGINDNGQIAATGYLNNGQQVAVLLTHTGTISLPALYWSGTSDNTWKQWSNWATNLTGTKAPAGPISTTDVIFSTTGAGNESTTLGADMAIRSLTVNDYYPVSIGGANTLTILSGSAITVGSGAGMLTISSGLALTPAGGNSPAIIVNNTGGALISGAISGTNGLTKAGAGTLVLSGANTYGDITTVSSGTLSISSDNNLGTAPAGVVANKLTLDGGTLETSATMALHINRGITLGSNGGTLNTDSGTVLAVPGAISGSSLTKTGDGTLILSGTQTYATLTTNGGTTNVDIAIGTGSSTVNANATTNFHVSQTLASLSIGDGAEVTFGDGLPFAGEPEKLGGSASVPEPGSLGLLLIGALGLLGCRQRRA